MSATATEEVDEFIDQNIQINTNKKMRDEFLHPWTLKFKEPEQEKNFGALREDMFRSNMLCVFIIWLMIVTCQTIIVTNCSTLFIFLGVATFIMTCLLVLVMAEEFQVCPELLAKSSTSLVHHRNRRSVFICCVIILMAVGSAIALLLCPFQPVDLTLVDNATDIGESVDARAWAATAGGGSDVRVNVFLTIHVSKNAGTGNMNQSSSATLFTPTGGASPDGTTKTSVPGYVNNTTSSGSGSPEGIDWPQLVSLTNLQNHLKHAISVRDVSSANSILNELLRHSASNKSQTNLPSDADRQLNMGTETALTTADLPIANKQDVEGELEDSSSSPVTDFDSCSHPEYLVFCWVLCLIALATALKLYYIIKTVMAAAMFFSYALLILVIFPDVFRRSNPEFEFMQMGMPLAAQMLILLAVFLTMVCYHARLVEVTSRLDFIWKEQAEKELVNMKSNRMLNDLLIKVSAARTTWG